MSEDLIIRSLDRAVCETPDRIATIDGHRTRTWRETGARVRRFATMLSELGILPGDLVGLLAPNGDVFVDFLFGTLWAGAVACPINTRWTASEIAYALADCGATVLIADTCFVPIIGAIRAGAPAVREVIIHDSVGGGALESRLAAAREAEERGRQGKDLAMILYTGGTTGAAKGVMLSHRALMAYARCLASSGESAPGDCTLHTAPLFHVGAISGFLASLVNGARHVFVPGFDPEKIVTAIASHGVTDLFLVPTMLQALLDHALQHASDLGSVRHIYYGAAPMPPALIDRAIAAMPGVGFVQGYGMTETSGSVALLKPSDHRPDPAHPDRLRSVGRAVMAVEVGIVDTSDNKVPDRTAGEIVVRGESVMTGYWNHPDETAKALRGGWLHTGDIGWKDEDGYIHVVDRLKDMIITGGENVYSIEVEAALGSHPAVAQCAVIGRPDPRWGEAVHAVIVLHPGMDVAPEDLIAHCRARIGGYKCPRGISFRDAMPLSAAGKIIKTRLHEDLDAQAPA